MSPLNRSFGKKPSSRSSACWSNRSGFTLIELAIVIIIVGIIISIVAGVLPSLIASSKIRQARAQLEKADNALQGYSIANFRLPFADNNGDGLEDTGIFSGTLPYRTMGLSGGTDVWGNSIRYAVYGVGGGANNLTRAFADADAFCAAITNASTAAFDINIDHTTTAVPCGGATGTNASNQAYVLASGGLKDMDGANGYFDGCNTSAGTGFNIPGKIQDTTYDDLVRAYALNELNQKNCSGSGGGGGGGAVENTAAGNCADGADNDGDGDTDCADSGCSTDPACTGPSPLNITTTSIPSGVLMSSYLTNFAATGGTTPYTWSLTNNGGFSDFSINSFTGTLTGTLDQCPSPPNYTTSVQVQDSTLPADGGPFTDSQSVSLQVTSDLSVARTSGSGTNITWSSPGQQETFIANGGRIGTVNWSLNTGGASGFTVTSSGADTGAIYKSGSTAAGTYTFILTAVDAGCATNTDDLILTVTVTASGSAAPGNINGTIDTLEFDTMSGYNPDIVQVGGDIYAIAYTGPNGDGFIRTVQIASDGQITNTIIDTFEFDNQAAIDPDIIHVAGEIFAIAYSDQANEGQVVTVQIDSAGQIANSTIDALEFDTNYCYEPDIIQISSDIYAIAYAANFFTGGVIKTIQIAGNGQITNSVVDTLVFDAAYWSGYEADLIHVSGDVYAVAYQDTSYDGQISTLSIDSAGQISNSIIDSLVFNTTAYDPDIVHVSGDIFAVAYEGPAGDGFISTTTIASDGQIANTVIDNLEFDTVQGREPVLLNIGTNLFAIAYAGPNDDGFFSTIQIDDTGQIGNAVLDLLEFDNGSGGEPSIVSVGPNMFAVAYCGQSNDGFVTTISLN